MMNKQNPEKPNNEFLKFSGLGIQLLAYIAIGFFVGFKVDEYFKFQIPWVAISLTFVMFFAGMYQLIKGLK